MNDSNGAALPVQGGVKLGRSSHRLQAVRRVGRFTRRKPVAALSALVILTLVVVGVAAPLLAPYSYEQVDLANRLAGPSSDHWLGTDSTGRDILSRIIFGAQTTVIISFSATFFALAVAMLVGTVSGYFGGIADTIIQRVVEVFQAFPALVFVIFVLSILSPSLVTVTLTIGILSAASPSRIVRSAVISTKAEAFIEAAASLGASHRRIMFRHVIPNVLPIVLVSASVMVGGVILVESALAFLGFGVPPPFPSWGRMLQDGQRFMLQYPHVALYPGIAITLVVFSFNMLGDGLRDALDPRLRGRS